MQLFDATEMRTLLGSLHRMHACVDMKAFSDRVMDVAEKTAGGASQFFDKWESPDTMGAGAVRVVAFSLPAAVRPGRSLRALERGAAEHPLVAHFRKTPASPPVAISDLCSHRAFCKTRLCVEHFAPLSIRDQLAACLAGPEPLVLVGAHHGKWGIGNKYCERLAAVQPQMALAYGRIAGAGVTSAGSEAADAPQLTPRLRQVLELVLSGLRTADIAAALAISRFTAQDYLARLYELYKVSGRAELMARHVRRDGPETPGQ